MRSDNRERDVSFSMPKPYRTSQICLYKLQKALDLKLKELCLYEPIIVDNIVSDFNVPEDRKSRYI